MNSYKEIKEILKSEKFFLSNLKKDSDNNRLKEWSRNFELRLKKEFENIPDFYYIFKFRERTDNFKTDINNAINILDEIEEYVRKKSDGLPPFVKEILGETLGLLEDSDEFDSKNIKKKIRDFEIWEHEVDEFIEMNFVEAFSSNFRRVTQSGYIRMVTADNIEPFPRILTPTAVYHLKSIRNILLEIMFNLGKNNTKIIKRDRKMIRNKMRCFLIGKPGCNEDIELHANWIFQAYDTSDEVTKKALDEINEVLHGFDLTPKPADKNIRNRDFMCKICQMIQESEYFLADLTGFNNNVILETGIAIGLSKKVFFISRDDSERFSKEFSDLKRSEIIFYDKDKLEDLKYRFQSLLKNELP